MKPVPQIMDDGREITVLKVGDDHCFIGSQVSRIVPYKEADCALWFAAYAADGKIVRRIPSTAVTCVYYGMV